MRKPWFDGGASKEKPLRTMKAQISKAKHPALSFLRVWIAIQVGKFADTLALPQNGQVEFLNWVVEAAVACVTWAVLKYVAPLIKDTTLQDALKNVGRKTGAASLLLFSGLAVLFLPSCGGYGVRGTAYFRDEETGAKGGLRFIPGAPPLPFFRVPVQTDSGSGFIDLTGGKN